MRNRAITFGAGIRAAICILCFTALACTVQAKVKILGINALREKLVLQHYQIDQIRDMRIDQGNIGYLTTGAHNFFLSAQVPESLPAEIRLFLDKNVKPYSEPRELSLYIYEYFLFEQLSLKGAEIALKTHFALFSKDGNKLLDYFATDTRNTGMNMGANASELMSRNLVNALATMDREIPVVLQQFQEGKLISLTCLMVSEGERNGLLAYHSQHRLNPRDFAGRAPSGTKGSHAACGLAVTYHIRVTQGKAEAVLWLFPYFDPSKSWLDAKKNIRDQMNYEQIYFSLSEFVARELIAELRVKAIPLQQLSEKVEELNHKYTSRLKELQLQYQEDTKYGTDKSGIEKWKRYLAVSPEFLQKDS